MSSETDMTFKILTIGESGVGKTCIAQRFVKDKFNKNHLATIGVDYFDKKLHINNKDIRLKIWDTAGQERFKTLTAQYYKGADGILLVYDVTDEESYEKIRDWMGQITLNTKKDDIGLVLLGNKCDIQQRKVTKGMGDKLGEELKIKYFETSALSGQGINESFEELARIIMKKRGIGEGNKGTGGVNLNKKQREEGCQCC
jgi:Ras-related protein Rab-8A